MVWPWFVFVRSFVRGIIVGKLAMEMCGNVQIRCPQTSLCFNIDFKPKVRAPSYWPQSHATARLTHLMLSDEEVGRLTRTLHSRPTDSS